MDLRRWLYSSGGLWLGALMFLLPSGLLMFLLSFLASGRRARESTLMLVIIGLLALAQVVCWVAVSRVVHYRIDAFSRRVWLVLLAFCLPLHALVAIPAWGAFSGAESLWWGLAVVPLLEVLWAFLLVHRALAWRSGPPPPIFERRKTVTDWLHPRPHPDDPFDDPKYVITRLEMVGASVLGLLVGGMIVYGVWADDLIIPDKRRTLHVHGWEKWPVVAAYLCLFMGCVSILREYLDSRPDRYRYRLFRWWLAYFGWRIFILSVFTPLLRG